MEELLETAEKLKFSNGAVLCNRALHWFGTEILTHLLTCCVCSRTGVMSCTADVPTHHTADPSLSAKLLHIFHLP